MCLDKFFLYNIIEIIVCLFCFPQILDQSTPIFKYQGVFHLKDKI